MTLGQLQLGIGRSDTCLLESSTAPLGSAAPVISPSVGTSDILAAFFFSTSISLVRQRGKQLPRAPFPGALQREGWPGRAARCLPTHLKPDKRQSFISVRFNVLILVDILFVHLRARAGVTDYFGTNQLLFYTLINTGPSHTRFSLPA